MGSCIVRTAGANKDCLKESGSAKSLLESPTTTTKTTTMMPTRSDCYLQPKDSISVRTLMGPRGSVDVRSWGGAKGDTEQKSHPRFKHASQSIP
jgi:hypothetical protein